MRIMLFGFSVTVQRNGYFAALAEMLSGKHEVTRYAIEAAQHPLMRHLIDDALQSQRPDVVIFEIATGGNRTLPYAEAREWDYRNSISHLINRCQAFGAKVGFLRLPRHDVVDDWQRVTDESVASHVSAPVETVPFDRELVYDGTHTSPIGAVEYAKRCLNLLSRIDDSDQNPGLFALEHDYISVPAVSALVLGGTFDTFERGGYCPGYVKVRGGCYAALRLGETMRVVGFSCIYGPDSGQLDIFADDTDVQSLMAYDRRCYYSRPALTAIKHIFVDGLVFRQAPEVPSPLPVKGEKYHGTRFGRIGHVLALRKV